MATDEEKANGSHYSISGFGSFADLIASDADCSTAVYKRFDRLNARDLLYYEAELLEIQAHQDQYDHEDAFDTDKPDNVGSDLWHQIQKNARDWSSFRQSANEAKSNDDRWKKRMQLAMHIRRTLKQYR